MDFLITIASSGKAHPVVLTVPPDARFGEVEPLLAQFVERKATWHIDGRMVRDEDLLIEAGLCDGAVLVATGKEAGIGGLSVRAPKQTDIVGQVEIVRGPDMGTVWKLRRGTYVIGRSESSDLVVPSDEEISRHHARLQIDDDGAYIEDLGSSNGTLVAGARVTSPTRVLPGESIDLGGSRLCLSMRSGPVATVVVDKDGSRVLNRPPRIAARRDPVRLSVPTPPGERQSVTFSVIGVAAPLLIGVVMAIFVKPIFALFAVLSPVMMISTYVTDRRRGSHSHRGAVAEYHAREVSYTKELAAAVGAETAELRDAYPGPAEIAGIATGPLVRLWERRPEDPDFLELRVGLCDRPSRIELIGGPRPGGPEPAQEDRPVLKEVPATISLAQAGVLGVCGGPAQVDNLAAWLVLQLATLHAPDDVRVVVLAPSGAPERWDWAMWLPHLRTERESRLVELGLDDEAVARLASAVSAVIDARLQSRETPRPGEPGRAEQSIVVVLGAAHKMRANPAVARILRFGSSVGVYAVCLAGTAPQLPEECRAVVEFAEGEHSRVDLRLPDGTVLDGVVADNLSAGWAEATARALAPLRLDRHRDRTGGLPQALSLLDALGMEPPTPEAITEGWAANGRTTAAVIGATGAGQLFVDLQRDGPHGLVAGTTGSGKSELLQTLIASLAVANRPDALNFVLVDYKGGSAFSACEQLPHTVGMVTDLNGHLTERALESLAAELRRREKMFRDAGVKDIDDYWRLLDRKGPVPAELVVPRVLIVIDEFASLALELPEFVDGLVDLARRGRSLGIHLILATQRPAGVVSAAIKTNTNLRVAMRVTDSMDSTDVIDSPLAARISKSTPGRGYVRVGHDQLVEFQAARVGGRRQGPSTLRARPQLRALTTDLLSAPLAPVARGSATSDNDETDLAALVKAIGVANSALGIAEPRSPWLDPLPGSLVLSDLATSSSRSDGVPALAFGLEDLPDEQAQAVASFDLSRSGHLFVAGDPGSGRSTLLRTIAGSAAVQTSPADLHMYALDCGNGALLPLSALPHCGAVVSRTEVERADRLIATLAAEVKQRQSVLAAGGFANISDQRAGVPAEERLAYILVLLDRWEGFTTTFDGIDGGRVVSAFQNLLREGPGVGLLGVLTGDRTVLVGRMATMAEQRLVLRLNDRASYSMAGLNPRRLPEEVPAGRAFRADSGREIQVAMLSKEPTGPAQVMALNKIAERCRSEFASLAEGVLPEPVAALPTKVDLVPVLEQGAGSARSLCAPIGVGGNRLGPIVVDLIATGPGYMVVGPRQSGRSNVLVVLGRALAAAGNSVIGIVSPLPSPLERLSGQPGVQAVLNGRTATAEELNTTVASATGPVVVLVDDVDQLFDAPVMPALENLLRGARQNGRAVVIAGGTAELNAAAFKGIVAEAKKSRAGLILSPSGPTDADIFGARLPRTALFTGPAGRAVQIDNGAHRLVQVADAGPGETL
jgi:S-DNA-T family DNA segregation ATPase FtsK/SpoIIIE